MKRLLLLVAAALAVVILVAALERPEWRLDAATFTAFWAAVAISLAVAADAAIARRRGSAGFFAPGLPGVVPTFRIAMAVIAAAAAAIILLEGRRPHATDSYAVGAGALVPHALAVAAVLACLVFATFRRWYVRLTLATAAACVAAFTCMAATWWLQ